MSDNVELRVNRMDIPAELPLPVPPVSYREEVRIFMMGQDLAPRYEIFERETTERVVQMMEEGDTSGLLPWFTTLLRFPDMPWLNWTCKTRAGVVLGEVQALSETSIPPLERGLRDYVEEQYWKQLPVLVFTENSGPFDDQDHLKALFETHVRNQAGEAPSVAVLSSAVRPDDRAAWLEQRLQERLDVLVCNPVLLEVGFDLHAFSRIIYKRTPVTFARLRQSARCSHRPGQTHDVEVVFCMYASSMALRWLYTMLHSEQQGPTHDALAALAREVLKSYQQGSRYQMDDFSGLLSRAEP